MTLEEEKLADDIHNFLEAKPTNQYWRAIELHSELIGPGSERLLEVKTIVEDGVKDGHYERRIVDEKKTKRKLVGYRLKRRKKQTITSENVRKASDILGEDGWERQK